MSVFDIDVDSDTGVLHVRVTEPLVELVQLEELLQQLYVRMRGRPESRILFEIIASVDLSSAAMQGALNFVKSRRPEELPPSRTAVVANSEVAYGLSRMFQLLGDGTVPIQMMVFRSTDEATAWLLEDDGN